MLGFYMHAPEFVEMMDNRDDVKGYWDRDAYFRYMDHELRARKGFTQANQVFHEAEITFRFIEHEMADPDEDYSHYTEIIRLIRMSGPLNREPEIDRVLQALDYELSRIRDQVRRLDREIRSRLSRIKPDDGEPNA